MNGFAFKEFWRAGLYVVALILAMIVSLRLREPTLVLLLMGPVMVLFVGAVTADPRVRMLNPRRALTARRIQTGFILATIVLGFLIIPITQAIEIPPGQRAIEIGQFDKQIRVIPENDPNRSFLAMSYLVPKDSAIVYLPIQLESAQSEHILVKVTWRLQEEAPRAFLQTLLELDSSPSRFIEEMTRASCSDAKLVAGESAAVMKPRITDALAKRLDRFGISAEVKVGIPE